MKIQRSRFRIITLLLLCGFLTAVFFCARQAELIPASPGFMPEAGETPVPEESLNQPDEESQEYVPTPEPLPENPSPFDTTGL